VAWTVFPAARAAGQVDEAGEQGSNAALVERLAKSMVKVRYFQRYDKGQPPPNEESLRLEYPHEEPGFLLENGLVCTEDIMIHERFIDRIEVSYGEQILGADIVSFGVDQDGMIVRLDGSFAGARPLVFDVEAEGPLFATSYVNTGLWGATLSPLSNTTNVRPGQTPFVGAPMQAAIVSGDGTALGVTMTGELPTDGSWKGPPTEWEAITGEGYEALAARIGDVANQVLPRAVINFRSPRSQANAFSGMGAPEEEATEWAGSAIVFAPNRALILAKFKPRTTARTERIRLYLPGSEPVEATFVGSLKDWGAFVVAFDESADVVADAIGVPINRFRNRLLVTAEVTVQGTSRVQYVGREWLRNFTRGWRGRVYPNHWSVNGFSGSPTKRFMFSLEGQLVAFPIERREKVTVDERSGGARVLAPANYVLDAAMEGGGAFDPDNRPLSEREESRVAWLGVELQRLDQELARLYGVSELSQDGMIGAVVTYIYPNSPATEMGLRQGDIILRVHAKDQPRPLDVVVEEDYSSIMDQYWAEIENIPAQVFDQIPTPWPNVDNAFNRSLTDLGFGSSARLEVFRDGELLSRDFTVTQGPDHYNAAARFESESLGMDVRDMTYEVRRYLQLTEADTGVIVSKLEPGEKAAVAGLKPYELIIAVNDEPVTSVERFEELIEGQSELRFSVKRRDKGRVVKIRMN
jgi:serine protease Do